MKSMKSLLWCLLIVTLSLIPVNGGDGHETGDKRPPVATIVHPHSYLYFFAGSVFGRSSLGQRTNGGI